jgi:hypothetical protein
VPNRAESVRFAFLPRVLMKLLALLLLVFVVLLVRLVLLLLLLLLPRCNRAWSSPTHKRWFDSQTSPIE